MNDFFFALWFFLPAGLANVTPIFACKIPGLSKWNTPVDLGYKLNGVEVLGTHKTIRGIVSGTLIGVGTFQLQIYTYDHYSWARELSANLNYSELTPILLGLLLGFGALFGDLLKSFFKRQFKVKSGKSWFPFDQLDYILGGIIFSLIAVVLSLTSYIWILLVWFLLHLISSYFGYWLKLKDSPI